MTLSNSFKAAQKAFIADIAAADGIYHAYHAVRNEVMAMHKSGLHIDDELRGLLYTAIVGKAIEHIESSSTAFNDVVVWSDRALRLAGVSSFDIAVSHIHLAAAEGRAAVRETIRAFKPKAP